MGKCLVTKLKGAVDNQNLLRIGEMRIKFNKVSNPTDTTQCIIFKVSRDTKIEIIGDGYFTDSSLAQNNGKNLTILANVSTEVYVSNNDIEFSIPDKYAIANISVKEQYRGNASFDIEGLKFSTSLTNLYLTNMPAYGDIINLKNLTALTKLTASNTQISGDIAALKNLTALTNINLDNTQISGDIINLKNLTKLTNMQFKNVTGLTGDMGTLPDNILFFTGGSGKFTWTTSSRTYILATEKAHCDKIDDMLNDMATKTAKFAGDSTWYKRIELIGTRTSASDAAVATLQSKGYTVSITPA